jgi:apolipoprotein N-acyltransferase
MVAIDYALSFSPFATILSGAVGLYGLRELSQIASVAGIWGLGFVAFWLAPALNAFAENGFDLKAAGRATTLPLAVFAAVLAYGAIRIGTAPIGAPTVRVAGVSAEHPRDYWNLIDEGTPREKVLALGQETRSIQDALFEASERAAALGSKIILWSEGACVLNQDEEAAFIERAGGFAKRTGTYLAAAVLTLHYGSGISDNKVLMFTPEGRLAFTYVKTISWYPTGSDGVLKVVDSPWGRIGAAICFDMDTPAFARGFSKLGADIVLVPSYDSAKIRPFHTEVGLYRAVENGWSMFRQVAEGTSMAVDGRGILRGMQDYFAGKDRLFVVDLPVKAEKTVYALVGDVFARLDLALLVFLCLAALGILPRIRPR